MSREIPTADGPDGIQRPRLHIAIAVLVVLAIIAASVLYVGMYGVPLAVSWL